MPQAIRDGIFTVLFISGPMVLLAAALGLIIGIIQAATQVQEQTLGSAVKILGVFLALIVFGFYMFQYLKQYTSQTISRAFNLVPTLSSHPLPPKKLFKQPLKDEETDHPLFSPEELAETAPATGGGASNAAKEAGAATEEPDIVEVLPEPNVDKLPQINYLTRPPSGIKEAVMQTLAPESPEAETEAIAEPEAKRPTTQTQTTRSTAPSTRAATQQPKATTPVTQTARPAARQEAAKPATAPVAAKTTIPATRVAPRPAPTRPTPAKPAPVVAEEVPEAPIIRADVTQNTEVDASRARARAALARIQSSIKEQQGAAKAE